MFAYSFMNNQTQFLEYGIKAIVKYNNYYKTYGKICFIIDQECCKKICQRRARIKQYFSHDTARHVWVAGSKWSGQVDADENFGVVTRPGRRRNNLWCDRRRQT